MRSALALYSGMPWTVKAHTRLRAWTCPFAPVVERLPRSGRLLDVGCGHGLLANAAALGRPELQVLGVDPSAGKIHWAGQTAAGRGNVTFRRAWLAEVGERDFDAVAVLDVLYLVPRREWPSFLRGCREHLRPGGTLLLKEVARRPRWKFYRCVLQEQLSVRLLGITLGSAFAFAEEAEMRALLAEAGLDRITVTDLGAGYLTPHVLYEAARP